MNVTPAMVDVAVAQTYRAGMRYAAIPLPWAEDWIDWVCDNGSSLPEPRICGVRKSHPGHVEAKDCIDDEGNVIFCLLDIDHDGPCGFEIHQQPQG